MIDADRFGGIVRLYGAAAAERFASARVGVVGIGGWGPGRLKLWRVVA